jgi:hypothetical protein
MTRCCPINEQTGDGVPVGRCYFLLKDGEVCERHGDVSFEVKHLRTTGELTLENSLRRRRGLSLLE